MTPTLSLSRLLRRPPIARALEALAPAGFDVDGDVLRIDDGNEDRGRAPVQVDGKSIAGVVGHDARRVAGVLSSIAAVEAERRRLADEVLNLYREINLLYDLAERLSGATSVHDLAGRMRAEATRLVPADAAEVIVDGAPAGHAASRRHGDAGDLGRARIEPTGAGATLVAPITMEGARRGAIVLTRHEGAFSAAELKRVTTVAGHGALLLGGVLESERRHFAAARREQRLRAEIETLQIELDQSRGDDETREGAHIPELWARVEALRALVQGSTATIP